MIVVFDLDGTLIDSAADIHAAGVDVMRHEGLEPVSFEQSRSFIGNGAGVFVERLIATVGPEVPADLHGRMLKRFLEIYESAVTRTTVYPGAEAALDLMAQHNLRFGICTNKPEAPARAVLRHFGMLDRFESVIGGDSLALRKPDPAPLRHVLDAMGGGPAVYVGDSEVDAQTALAAGLPFALFSGGYRHSPVDQIPHERVFDHHDQLPAAVASLLRV